MAMYLLSPMAHPIAIGDNKWRCHIQNRHQRLVATVTPIHCRHELLMAILNIASPFKWRPLAIGCAIDENRCITIGDKNGAIGENHNSS